MKTIKTLINNPLPTPDQQQAELERQQKQSAERLLSRELITHLWELMTNLYGHRWTSSFGDQIDPANVWAASLRGITSSQIRAGFAELVRQGYDWPPSAPEFRKICDGGDTKWESQCHKIYKPETLLEDQGAKERAKIARAAAIKEMYPTMDINRGES